MRRWLFNLATAVSLILCVCAVLLWVRSYWGGDGIDLSFGQRQVRVQSYKGRVLVLQRWASAQQWPSWQIEYRSADLADQVSSALLPHVAGFGYWSGSAGWASTGTYPAPYVWGVDRYYLLPHWFVAALLSILPAIRVYRLRNARHIRRQGLCPTCGYDLRATPQRCPECGAMPAGGDRRSGLSDQKSQTVPPSV